MAAVYPQALKQFILRGIELELLAPQLAEFDLDRLGRTAARARSFIYLSWFANVV